jgi:nitrous oxidase accessory protein NosD
MRRTDQSKLIMIVLCTLPVFGLDAMGVTVPAGSVDQLAAAIAEAGPGGEVVLQAGVHKESGTVLVNTSVSIVGEDGAVLETGTTASTVAPIVVQPALHIKGADGTRVQNLSIRAPEGTTANCAILIEDSANVEIVENEITKHQVGILIQRGDHARIQGNTIQIVSEPDSDRAENGVVVINGHYVTIQDNRVTGALMGIFISSQQGDASGNTTWGNVFGVIFCMPSGLYEISGEVVTADSTATGWVFYQNTSVGNSWGYIVIDGATQNVLVNNSAALNAMYDIELAGDSMRFGFLTPTSHDNLVVQGLNYKGLKVKNCGTNNQVRGHVSLVDTTEDACF